MDRQTAKPISSSTLMSPVLLSAPWPVAKAPGMAVGRVRAAAQVHLLLQLAKLVRQMTEEEQIEETMT